MRILVMETVSMLFSVEETEMGGHALLSVCHDTFANTSINPVRPSITLLPYNVSSLLYSSCKQLIVFSDNCVVFAL